MREEQTFYYQRLMSLVRNGDKENKWLGKQLVKTRQLTN